MPYFLKLLSVFLLATVKFFYTPLYAYLTGLDFLETSISMISGGVASFLIFYYLSYFVVISTKHVKPFARRFTPNSWLKNYYERKERRVLSRKPKKKFTRRNRFIIKLRRVGMWAIIFATPVAISIPIGAFLLRKYFSKNKGVVVYALLAIAIEGLILCWAVWNIPGLRP
jgi:hypothetical protein